MNQNHDQNHNILYSDDDFLYDDLDSISDQTTQKLDDRFPQDQQGYHVAKTPEQRDLDKFMNKFNNNNHLTTQKHNVYQLTIPAFKLGTLISIQDMEVAKRNKEKLKKNQHKYNQKELRRIQNKEQRRTARDEAKGRTIDLYNEELDKIKFSLDRQQFKYNSTIQINVNQDTDNHVILDLIDQAKHVQSMLKILFQRKNKINSFKGRRIQFKDPIEQSIQQSNQLMSKDHQERINKTKQGCTGLTQAILIMCLISQICLTQCLICPNKGVYINTNKNPNTIAQSLCDLDFSDLLPKPDNLRYLAHQSTCIYQMNNSIKNTLIYEYNDNYLFIYQYLDKMIHKIDFLKFIQKNRLPEHRFINAIVLNNIIINQGLRQRAQRLQQELQEVRSQLLEDI